MLVDSPAPDFKLAACMPDNSFAEVSLSDYHGKVVVLFFYPADFTFVCASEVPGFSAAMAEFTSRNVVVLACSTDTEHAHKAWKLLPMELGGLGGQDIAVPMLADTTKDVSKAYDVLLPNGLAARGLFLIDEKGIVRIAHTNTLPLGRSTEEILRLVDAWQFHVHSEKTGQTMVCPLGWKKGQKAMMPTLAGVAEFNKAA